MCIRDRLNTPSLTIGTLNGLLYGNSGAVSTASVSSPLTYSAGTLSIQQATGSQSGYLSSTDWTSFANKVSSTSLSALYPLAYNSTTGVFSTAFGTTTANSFNQLQQFNANASTTQLSVSGNSYFTTVNTSGTETVGNLINNGVTASTLLYANGSKQESSVTLPAYLTLTSGTLAISSLPNAQLQNLSLIHI